jgi:type II secretory pathway pseudopilin PulG
MEKIRKESGFTLVEALIIIVVVAAIAFAGWWVWNKNQDDKKADNTSQNANKDESSSQPTSKPKVSLLSGAITLSVPNGWKEGDAPHPCQSPTDKTACQAQAFVVPTDGPKTLANEPYGAYSWAYTAGGATSAQDWFVHTYEGGSSSAQDQTSTDPINGYSTYVYKQNTDSYNDVWYVFLKGDTVVVVYSRLAEKHFTSSGQVDQTGDYTRYASAAEDFAKSVTIK